MAESNAKVSLLDDTGTLILYCLLALAAGIALSPVGFIGIAIPIILYKLSRRPNWILAYVALCFALFTVGILLGSVPMLWEAYKPVLNALPRFDPVVVFHSWLGLLAISATWFTLLPLGGVIGAIFSMIAQEGEQSQLEALMRGKAVAPPKRAPLADWFQRRINAKPARHSNGIVLGGDWRTGQAITISDDDLNKHLLVAGTTGAGKTVGVINLIEGAPGVAPSSSTEKATLS